MKPSRKQREIQEREQRLLDVAQSMLLERGYLGLTMDRIADQLECSKGTVYQHFGNKEDLLAAVAVRSGELRAALFERATRFRGLSRERIGALGAAAEVFMRLYPHHEQAEKLIRSASIRSKVAEQRRQELTFCESRCMNSALGIIRDAVAGGELQLREEEGQGPESLTFGLWSLYVGSFLVMDLDLLGPLGIEDPRPHLLRNAQTLLDGVGWRPLSSEFDYLASRDRALREIFPAEAERAELL